jgi:glycosyltransferase involved in cell wall biosynthesis
MQRPRVLLFDWTVGGHHVAYAGRFAEALQAVADVVVALPERGLGGLDASITTYALPSERLPVAPGRGARDRYLQLAKDELVLLRGACDDTRPHRAIHLYADPLLRALMSAPPFELPLVLVLFQPRAHYRSAFGDTLTGGEMWRALRYEWQVQRVARRRDIASLLCLDAYAVARWQAKQIPAVWQPEPPAPVLASAPPRERAGSTLFGALGDRKGIDLLAEAVVCAPRPLHLTLAGRPEAGYEQELDRQVNMMRRAGARVDLRLEWQSEQEAMRLLAGSASAVLPYKRHFGSSGVLVEAASVGTPVIAHRFGLLGQLVRERRLGLAVDCFDQREFGDALVALEDAATRAEYEVPLRTFANEHTRERFEAAIRKSVGLA